MEAITNNTTPNFADKLRIEAIQTVIPAKVTEPRTSRRISVVGQLRPDFVQKHMQVLLYYKKSEEEECGLEIGGWLKDSLSLALCEQPMMAGRLHKTSDGEFDLINNDSGVRLVQAQMDMSLSEFLLESGGRKDAEPHLCYWKDLDEQNPQFYALFYVQVTNFEGDGYSIGITCSHLLADPWLMATFLRMWAGVHSKLLSQNDISKLPLFYLPNFKRTGESVTLPSASAGDNHQYQSMVFKLSGVGPERLTNSDHREARLALTRHCFDQVKIKYGIQLIDKFSTIVSNRSGDRKVETCEKEKVMIGNSYGNKLKSANWEELGANEVSFYRGNKPVLVSYSVGAFHDEGLVTIMPTLKEGTLETMVCATVPMKLG